MLSDLVAVKDELSDGDLQSMGLHRMMDRKKLLKVRAQKRLRVLMLMPFDGSACVSPGITTLLPCIPSHMPPCCSIPPLPYAPRLCMESRQISQIQVQIAKALVLLSKPPVMFANVFASMSVHRNTAPYGSILRLNACLAAVFHRQLAQVPHVHEYWAWP